MEPSNERMRRWKWEPKGVVVFALKCFEKVDHKQVVVVVVADDRADYAYRVAADRWPSGPV